MKARTWFLAATIGLALLECGIGCAPQQMQDCVNSARALPSYDMATITAAYPNPATMPTEAVRVRASFEQIKALLGPVKAWMTWGDPNSPANR